MNNPLGARPEGDGHGLQAKGPGGALRLLRLLGALNSSALHTAASSLRGVWSPPNATDCTIYNKLLRLRARPAAAIVQPSSLMFENFC